MSFEAVREMARQGRLYPAVILYGGSLGERQAAAVDLGRILLCAAAPAERPCGGCRACRRIAWSEKGSDSFHPDFHVLERDLRTSTSIDATKKFLAGTGSTPFEARGQVFVLAEADSLGGGAADALLKILEEPPVGSPRHFLLLTGSRLDLLPTLRSRSLSVYLGGTEDLDAAAIEALAAELGRALDGYFATASPVLLLVAAEVLGGAASWEDARARRPWATAAAAVLRYARDFNGPASTRRALLALAGDLLDGWRLRTRNVTAPRILDGLVARHLAPTASPTASPTAAPGKASRL